MRAVKYGVMYGVCGMRQKQKYEIRGDRAQLVLDGYTRAILEELMSTGDFKSISQLLQIAVINLYKDYEAKGKLRRPPDDAQERTRNAQMVEEREGEVE
ncbi:hypothetical protein [Geoglobus acetivorans]|uniref:Ribbon-helix-helix protein CopG domain-containing protein n=1 Tax=Geoglobus acetivorans TaxID=565033 RepID=A0ABZ3H4X5_GEOAI|nr:hypothetical protein [Geoglobus acetivorans]